jgi:hypothetical protein
LPIAVRCAGRVHEPESNMDLGGIACFGLAVGFFVVLLIGSVVLRAAVSIANRSAGPVRAEVVDPFPDWDWDDESEDEPRRSGEKAIPEPGLAKGMMITSTIAVLTAFIGVVLRVLTEDLADAMFGGDDEVVQIVALVVVALPFSFAGATLLLVAMLPTTFWRAALVAFLHHIFAVFLLGVVFGTIVVLLNR